MVGVANLTMTEFAIQDGLTNTMVWVVQVLSVLFELQLSLFTDLVKIKSLPMRFSFLTSSHLEALSLNA